MTTNKALMRLAVADTERTAMVCKALGNESRLRVLQNLVARPAILSDLAQQLNMPLSSLSAHVDLLEKAGLISVTSLLGSRGGQKRCAPIIDSVLVGIIDKAPDIADSGCMYRLDMPVGNYFNYEISAPCGIASAEDFLAPDDDPAGFAVANHCQAQMLWLSHGQLEYRFPAKELMTRVGKMSRVEFTLELCAETYGFDESWRSDVSVWINGVEIGFIECMGDHGGRRGLLNPRWWPAYATQYGDLHKITITRTESFLDAARSPHTLQGLLKKNKDNSLRFTIGVKPTARYAGGMNLFGAHFGDHAQGIVMQVYGEQ